MPGEERRVQVHVAWCDDSGGVSRESVQACHGPGEVFGGLVGARTLWAEGQ